MIRKTALSLSVAAGLFLGAPAFAAGGTNDPLTGTGVENSPQSQNVVVSDAACASLPPGIVGGNGGQGRLQSYFDGPAQGDEGLNIALDIYLCFGTPSETNQPELEAIFDDDPLPNEI